MIRRKYRFKRKPGMNEAETYARVEITWLDTFSDSSWLDTNEFIKTKPKICKTSGRLYKRKEGVTYIFGDWSLDDEGNIETFGNVTVIPNVLIKEIKVIK